MPASRISKSEQINCLKCGARIIISRLSPVNADLLEACKAALSDSAVTPEHPEDMGRLTVRTQELLMSAIAQAESSASPR